MKIMLAAMAAAGVAVSAAGCGGLSDAAKQQLHAQQLQLIQGQATLKSQQSALDERERHAVAHIQAKRDRLRSQVDDLRSTADDLDGRIASLRHDVHAKEHTVSRLEARATGLRSAIRRGTIPGSGTFLVGTDIDPGTYRAAASPGCYWERETSLSGGIDSIADNDNADGPVVVQISPSDAAFKTSGCASFHKIA